jgi:hypothetical protein
LFNEEEIKAWEQAQLTKVYMRYCPSKNERMFDPNEERDFKARKACHLNGSAAPNVRLLVSKYKTNFVCK